MAEVALKRDLEDYNGMIDQYNKQAGKYKRAGKVYNEGVTNYNAGVDAYNNSFMKTTSGQLAIFRLRDLKKYPGQAYNFTPSGEAADPRYRIPNYVSTSTPDYRLLKSIPDSPIIRQDYYMQTGKGGVFAEKPGQFTLKPPDASTAPKPLEEGPRVTISQGNRFQGKYGWADAERGGLVDDARRTK